MEFTSASLIHSQPRMMISEPLRSTLGNTLHELSMGSFVIIESDSLKSVHTGLHQMMIDAYIARIPVQFVDVANCFNPHVLASFNRNTTLDDILENITLARPFQYYQSVSILDSLIINLLHKLEPNQIILITAMDHQIIDNEDRDQLQSDLTHLLGGLQNIAVRGNIVMMTNQIRKECRDIFTTYSTMHLVIEEGRGVVKIN